SSPRSGNENTGPLARRASLMTQRAFGRLGLIQRAGVSETVLCSIRKGLSPRHVTAMKMLPIIAMLVAGYLSSQSTRTRRAGGRSGMLGHVLGGGGGDSSRPRRSARPDPWVPARGVTQAGWARAPVVQISGCVCTDDFERRDADEALCEREERCRSMSEQSPQRDGERQLLHLAAADVTRSEPGLPAEGTACHSPKRRRHHTMRRHFGR